MSVEKRGKTYSLRIRPFGEKQVTVRTTASTKREAERIEQDVIVACRAQSYETLDVVSRAVCMEMFRNRKWAIPADLGQDEQQPEAELTLWKAMDLTLNSPDIRLTKNRTRHVVSFTHLVKHFGKDYPVKTMWVTDIKEYQAKRLAQGAAHSTVSKERAALSVMFRTLIELRHMEVNPVRLTKGLPTKYSRREAYLSYSDVQRIARRCPQWFQDVIWFCYYTGARKGEAMGLRWSHVNLSERMIQLRMEDTKEGQAKRIPLRHEVVRLLENLKVRNLKTDKVFLVNGHEPGTDSFGNPWARACAILKLPKPWPVLHDLRHTWRANARRSGVDPLLAETILGHAFKGKSVMERYGWISDEELIRAVDKMEFGHGETRIFAAVRPGR